MEMRPTDLNLVNWRTAPHSRWSFHHVREVVPSATITTSSLLLEKFSEVHQDFSGIAFKGTESENWTLDRLHEETSCDAFLVAHQGKLVHEWYRQESIENNPHIVFSISNRGLV